MLYTAAFLAPSDLWSLLYIRQTTARATANPIIIRLRITATAIVAPDDDVQDEQGCRNVVVSTKSSEKKNNNPLHN